MPAIQFTWASTLITLLTSWGAGTLTRVAGLAGRDETLTADQFTALILLFQRADIPMALVATVPLCASVTYFGEARKARYVALAISFIAGIVATASIIALAGRGTTATGGVGHMLVMELPNIAAFHATPALLVIATCIVYDHGVSRRG